MTKPVVIIGAGPAGLSCASRLVNKGLSVVIIDDNLQAGGQYFRQLPQTYRALPRSELLRETERVGPLFSVLEHQLVTYLPSTTAWASPEALTIAYAGAHGTGRIAAHAIVIATGAHDKPLPFPGWTLPGVISAGGCLNLAKGHGLVPTGKIVVAGNGPLVLVAAATLAAAGAEITHVVEAQPTRFVAAAMAVGLFYCPSLVMKGIGYRARLLKSGVKFVSGKMIARAIGDEILNAVEIAPVGADGRPDMAFRSRLSAQTLITGYALLPGAEFAGLMGCRMVREPVLGGWVPERSERFETSVPCVYAIGDGAGIGGVEIAIAEGHLAAEAIIGSEARNSIARKRYGRLNRFRHILSNAYRLKTRLVAADDETIICRCEELRLSELKAFALPEDRHLHRLKTSTRLGMGRCQGRNCLTSAATIFELDHNEPFTPFPRFRPPARPVRVRDIIEDKSIGPAREPDESSATITQENHR